MCIHNEVKTEKPRKGELYYASTYHYPILFLIRIMYAHHLHLRLKILTDLVATLITILVYNSMRSVSANRVFPTNRGVAQR